MSWATFLVLGVLSQTGYPPSRDIYDYCSSYDNSSSSRKDCAKHLCRLLGFILTVTLSKSTIILLFQMSCETVWESWSKPSRARGYYMAEQNSNPCPDPKLLTTLLDRLILRSMPRLKLSYLMQKHLSSPRTVPTSTPVKSFGLRIPDLWVPSTTGRAR